MEDDPIFVKGSTYKKLFCEHEVSRSFIGN
jgi:hypothetical protein